MNGFCHYCNTRVETLKHLFNDCTVIQQNWIKTLSAIQKKNYINSQEIQKYRFAPGFVN
jgi:hypothetical protein